MATVQTIATTLTADASGAKRGFTEVGDAAEKLGVKVSRLDRQMQQGLSRPAGGRNLAGGFLEFSRGLEDASVGYQLNGIQGAVRGASNNLTSLAMLVGGPVTGAIAGLAAAALPMLINKFVDLGESAAETNKRLEQTRATLDRVAEGARVRVQFEELVSGLDSTKELESQIKEREGRLRQLGAEMKALDGERAVPPGVRGEEREKQMIEREREVREKQNKLLEEQVRLENELNRLRAQRPRIAEDEAGAEDWEKRRNAAEEAERTRERDRQQIERMLTSKMQALGGEVDPLEGLNIPRGMESQIRGLLDQLDDLDKGGGGGLATALTSRGDVARAQFQDKAAAAAKEQREKVVAELRRVVEELKALRKNEEGRDQVDLN